MQNLEIWLHMSFSFISNACSYHTYQASYNDVSTCWGMDMGYSGNRAWFNSGYLKQGVWGMCPQKVKAV